MPQRLTAALLLLALAGCQRADHDNRAVPETKTAAEAPPEDRVPCTMAGQAQQCVVDTAAGEGGTVVTVHHPDGGFRRLLITSDGRGGVAADGAQPAAVKIAGQGEIEVTIAGDRYRLPATVRAGS